MAPKTQICASLNATNVKDATDQMKSAAAAGADLAELRLDLLGSEFDPQKDLRQLTSDSSLPLTVSCLPTSLG
jgi:3-dehydroquinate dehydratase